MNGFPDKFEILPEPIEKLLRAGEQVGSFLLRQLMHIQHEPLDSMSDHYTHPLDDMYFSNPSAPKENRWCDQGNYFEQ